jgi:Kef-type K+ transport system membrane component KefB
MQTNSLLTILLFDFSRPFKDPVLIFALVLFIILLAPIVFRKFRFPSIIGLILSGVIIGPHGLNLLKREGGILLFGTIGLVYIMFLGGLELDLNRFKQSRNRSIVFGIFTFIIPLAIGLVVCIYFLKFNFLSSLLIASMFSTHTLVAYPIASKLGIIKNEAVAITVGGTIITDTAVLIVLAVITAAAKGELNLQFWIQLIVSLSIYSFITVWGFPRIGKWFFKNIKGENTSQFIFVLAMVFLSGFLAEVAGIEAIIGAFVAGLALNRLIPNTSPLMNRIEFVGNALFIPFFLISVGMLVDLKVLFRGPQALIVAATLTIVAVLGKYTAALITQKIFKYSIEQRNIIFGLSNSHAAATLAVILVGFNMGLVNEDVLNGTIVLILFTCLIASFVTDNAGRKLAIIESSKTQELPESEEKMLIPVSDSTSIERLLDFTFMIKDARSPQPIHLVTVVQDDDKATEKVLVGNKILEKAVIHASGAGTEVKVITRLDLNISFGIARAAKEHMATEIMMGWSENIKTSNLIFGTTLDNLLIKSWISIYACKLIQPLNTIKNIVVVMPSNAEIELGFTAWLNKLVRLAYHSSGSISFYCDNRSENALKRFFNTFKTSIKIIYTKIEDIEEVIEDYKKLSIDDLIVFVSARKGTISFKANIDGVANKFLKQLPYNSSLIIYPEQTPSDGFERMIKQEDLEIPAIQENIDRITKLGKLIKRIFK